MSAAQDGLCDGCATSDLAGFVQVFFLYTNEMSWFKLTSGISSIPNKDDESIVRIGRERQCLGDAGRSL